jgi:hypothetical protein
MASAEKDESSRNLLDQIEGDWDSPRPPRTAATPEVQAALDAAAARLVDSLDPPPMSVPTMDELDSGWGKEEEDDEEEEEDDEEDEPELPDERLDPVAYALAKKAREEHIEARRVRRRAKDAAKKARRQARLDAQRSKQKGKQKKARPVPQARPSKEERNRARKAAATAQARARGRDGAGDDVNDDEGTDGDEELQPASLPSRAKAKLPPSRPMSGPKPMLSKTNQWMLAVAVVIFLAAAIFAAVIAR